MRHQTERIDWTNCAIIGFMTVVVFWVSLAAAGLLLRTGDIGTRAVSTDDTLVAADPIRADHP